MVPPKPHFSLFFSERSTKLPVNSLSMWLGSFQDKTDKNMSESYSSKCSKSKSPSHLHPCHEVKRLGHAAVTNGEEAETRRALPFLVPCLQFAHVWQVPRDHQRWPVAWPVSLCLRDTLTPPAPAFPSVRCSGQLKLQSTPRLWGEPWGEQLSCEKEGLIGKQ